jgi:hypothetical protein
MHSTFTDSSKTRDVKSKTTTMSQLAVIKAGMKGADTDSD